MIRLLVVEDSALMRKLMGQIFSAEGDFEIAFARNGVEALETIRTFEPDVVTLDIHMPQMDGLSCLNDIMLRYPRPVVMVSSLTDEGARETLEALEIGAVDFIAKPGGAITLGIDDMRPRLVEKVRLAASVKIKRSLRLTERLRLARAPAPTGNAGRTPARAKALPVAPRARAQGMGLVLIGCSTGGPPALDAVLPLLPADLAWPVIVAQHMPASFTGPLSQRLDKVCALTVCEVTRQMRLEPGHVYIARGDSDILVSARAGSLVVTAAPSDEKFRWHPSVDRLVRSAMTHLPAPSLIGVLMTGMGNDGAAAMADLHAAGGHTIAESEETAVVWGMPGELVGGGGASEIRRVDQIAASLMERLR